MSKIGKPAMFPSLVPNSPYDTLVVVCSFGSSATLLLIGWWQIRRCIELANAIEVDRRDRM